MIQHYRNMAPRRARKAFHESLWIFLGCMGDIPKRFNIAYKCFKNLGLPCQNAKISPIRFQYKPSINTTWLNILARCRSVPSEHVCAPTGSLAYKQVFPYYSIILRNLDINIYIYVCVFIYVCIWIHTHTHLHQIGVSWAKWTKPTAKNYLLHLYTCFSEALLASSGRDTCCCSLLPVWGLSWPPRGIALLLTGPVSKLAWRTRSSRSKCGQPQWPPLWASRAKFAWEI